MSRIKPAVLALVIIAAASAAAVAFDGPQPGVDGAKPAVTNKLCPVSGGAVNEKHRTLYQGQYVYLCCEGCLTEFNKTPEVFVAKLSKEDREAIKANDVCPITGEPIDKKLSVDYEGRRVYFCCDHCVDKFKKDHPAAKAS